MPTVNDYLTAIRGRYPGVNVDPQLMNELNRRAGEGAAVGNVLTDAAGYSETQVNPNLGMVKPISPADISGFQKQSAQVYDPQKQALEQSMSAKLKQTLASGDEQLRQDLSSRGFLRSGEQITRSDIQRTVAEADMALQQAGYLSDITNKETAYTQQLASNEMQNRQQNAQAELQNVVQNMGINQQAFQNMQTTLQQQAAVSGAQTALLTNPEFATLLTGIGSDARYQPLIVQMLQGLGFNVTM